MVKRHTKHEYKNIIFLKNQNKSLFNINFIIGF